MKNFTFIVFFFISFNVFFQPFVFCSPTEPYDYPSWRGDTAHFKVNPDGYIQLTAPKTSGSSFLSTFSSRTYHTSWECKVEMQFIPTSSNYVKLYLCSDHEILTGKLSGLYVRLGYTNKNISLIFQEKEKVKTLIAGENGRLNRVGGVISLRAELTESGMLSLYSRLEDETEEVLEGVCQVPSLPDCSYWGMVCVYTSTRNEHFFFSDLLVRELDEEETDHIPTTDPDSLDIVINEILFNPFAGSSEYIELLNRSEKELDLSALGIATRKSDGTLNKVYLLADRSEVIRPGEYCLLTKDQESVCAVYGCQGQIFCRELASMPVLANSSGCVVLLDRRNQVIDEVYYNEKMHVAGISNRKGVALERINSEGASNDFNNWSSASSDCGYGTPGYRNSQASTTAGFDIRILPPDLIIDSYRIQYSFQESAAYCRIQIFDMEGRLVHLMKDHELLGTEGWIEWNGKGNAGQHLRTGVYIISIEVCFANRKVRKYQLPVVVRNE